ncbi:MAG: acyl carrier protein [Clostridia bacterium]|nr:acyl carrier protein [Clostridia bacterium]
MTASEILLDFFKNEKKINDIDENTDLFREGHVNSLFALEMVVFLEKTFSFKIPRKEMKKDNFKSVAAMVSLVERLKN